MSLRKPEYNVLELIVDRWSPRAMSGEEISHDELMSLFEAARWAPSSYNNQPWRFIYGLKNTPEWDTLFNLLVPGNQVWAKNAAALIVATSHKNFEFNNKPSRTHVLDTGAATQNLALQGYSMNLVVHGMEGFDYDKARIQLAVPHDYTVEAMYAIGRHGDKSLLPDTLQEREFPSNRKTVEEITFQGTFGNQPLKLMSKK